MRDKLLLVGALLPMFVAAFIALVVMDLGTPRGEMRLVLAIGAVVSVVLLRLLRRSTEARAQVRSTDERHQAP